ncbi:MAG TPA: alcohol dehydrogenase catalytic domain-containing protein, partial [Polyangiaceae bacterium]|nr:alcohol dehydrogenase catalytic domain-containing protein [Polyangiaceae bacterium]
MGRALEFRVSVPQYLLTRAAASLATTAPAGALGGLRAVERPALTLPAEDWVMLEPIATGICGTDLATLAFKGPTALEPFASFPAVLGHEILARVSGLGGGVTGFELGDRVVVDPLISCRTRGLAVEALCASCALGIPAACLHAGESGPLLVQGKALARGNCIGFHAQLPGGWSSQMMAPARQLYRVPASVSDRAAVLTEPLAVATRAVVGMWPALSDSVLVIGSGPIALATIWALSALGYAGRLYAQVKRAHEQKLAERLGAHRAVAPGAPVRETITSLGGRVYKPLIGPEVYAGGFDCVFDCVGSSQSLDQAVRMTRAGGSLAMLGCCTQVRNVDLTFLWARQLIVRGFVAYGPERWQGRELHTFELVLELLERSALPITDMITHEFGLEDYRKALEAL